MKEQEVIKRLNFHKEYARLSSNRVVISETDLETVLSMLKEKDKEIEKKNVSYKKIWKLHQKGYSINKISKELDYDWKQVKIRINEIYDNPELLEKGE